MISFIVEAEGKKILVMWPVDVAEHEITHEGENSQLRREFQILTQLAAASSLTISFADLPGGAVGQTIGSTITLDTNAANYNWFIGETSGTDHVF